jgi:hypothetical protein
VKFVPLDGIRIPSNKPVAIDAKRGSTAKQTSRRYVSIVYQANILMTAMQQSVKTAAVVDTNRHRVKPIALNWTATKLLGRVVLLSLPSQKDGTQRTTPTILPYRVKQEGTAQNHLQKHVFLAQPVTLLSKETSIVFNVKRGNFPIKSILLNVQNATHDCVNIPTKLLPPVANVVQRTNVPRAPSVNL